MHTLTTVTEVLDHLRDKGYTVDFNLDDHGLVCHSNSLRVHPEDFVVDKHYRFEGMSDPADQAIVYAISSDKHRMKGVLLDGYGISSNPLTNALISALKIRQPSGVLPDPVIIRSNKATVLRPEGERVLDGEMVRMDLQTLIGQLRREDTYLNSDRNAMTLFKSEGMRMVLIALHQGAEMKTHKAPGTISVQVLDGEISFGTAREVSSRCQGEMLVLHAGIAHSVAAIRESVFLLTLALKG